MKVPHTQSNRHARRAFAAEMSKRLRTSGVTIIEVQHDDYCSLWRNSSQCDCNPHRVIKNADGKILAQFEDVGSYGAECPVEDTND